MTREEAIQRLKANRDAMYFPETIEALDMAIEALAYQSLSKPNNTCEVDLIRREDAIEAVRKKLQNWGSYTFEDYRRGLYEAQEILEALPSADGTKVEWIEVVRCKDCKYNGIWCDIQDIEWTEKGKPLEFCSYGERKEEE